MKQSCKQTRRVNNKIISDDEHSLFRNVNVIMWIKMASLVIPFLWRIRFPKDKSNLEKQFHYWDVRSFNIQTFRCSINRHQLSENLNSLFCLSLLNTALEKVESRFSKNWGLYHKGYHLWYTRQWDWVDAKYHLPILAPPETRRSRLIRR